MRTRVLTILVVVFLMTTTMATAQQKYLGSMNVDGAGKQLIYEHTGEIGYAEWSTDMNEIAFNSESSSTGRSEIFTYDRLAEQLCQLTAYGNYYGQAYASFRTDNTIWYMYTQQAGFSELRRIVYDDCNVVDTSFLTDWYSTGRQSEDFDVTDNYIVIYVQHSSSASTGELYIAPLTDLADTTRLTDNGTKDDKPHINHAETKIVYLHDTGVGTAANIYVMNIDGSNQTQLTFLTGLNISNGYAGPMWSEDDEQIYCSYWDGNQWDIMVMDAAGDNLTNITNTASEDERCQDILGNKMLITTSESLPIYSGTILVNLITTCIPVSGTIQVPVYTDMTNSACGMQVPITWSSEGDFDLVDVEFDGTALESWEYPAVTIDNENKTVVFGGAAGLGDVLAPGDGQIIAYLEFIPTFGCAPTDTFTITFDTTTVGPASLVFSDCDDPPATFVPSVDFTAATVYGYVAGDANGDCSVNIADAVTIINYVFRGGSAPVPFDAGDANGDCSVNIGDAVFLINYIFRGGPEPVCGCASGDGMIGYKAGQASLVVEYDGQTTTISSNAPIDIYGLQIEAKCKSIDDMVNNIDRTQLYAGKSGDIATIGVLDINGQGYVPAGNSQVLKISGQAEVLSAIGCDESGNVFELTINQTMRTLPEKFTLYDNYPNPFNPTTSIRYTLSDQADVTIDVFNIAGQKVANLVNESQEAGEHAVVWDSKDHNGQAVSSGIYFYRLTAGAYSDTKKMVLLK